MTSTTTDTRTMAAEALKPGDVIGYGRDWLEVFDSQPLGHNLTELRLIGPAGVQSYRVNPDAEYVLR